MSSSPPLFQFSIRHLIGATIFVAVGCLAIVNANRWWSSALFAVTVSSLVLAVMLIIYRTGLERAFWVGFVLGGGVHFILAFFFFEQINRSSFGLVTDNLTIWIWEIVVGKEIEEIDRYMLDNGLNTMHYLTATRSLWTIVIGVFFGGVCRFIAWKKSAGQTQITPA